MVWVVATVGVTYVANAAVELVDLQVFPRGARIEVLARAAPPPTTVAVPTRTANLTTTSAVPTTVPPVTTTTVAPVVTTALPVTTTTVAVVVTTLAPTTTTTTAAPPAGATTTTSAPVPTTTPPTTTTRSPTTTTTGPPATTTTAASVPLLVVGTGSLPEARIGETYSVGLMASGGTPPYVWSLAGGSLPAGISLSSGGVLAGVPVASADTTLVFGVTDAAGRAASSTPLVFATAADRRTVAARGGTVFVDVVGDSVSLFLASPADGFSAVIIESGGFRVEVQFVPLQGDATSWVVCEVADGVICTNG